MLNTRMMNDWLGTSYSMDEVSEMDPLMFAILTALRQGLNPKKVSSESIDVPKIRKR